MATQAEQFVEKVTKLPLGQKIGIVTFLVAGITAANFFLLVQPTRDDFDNALKRMRALEDEMIQNQAIANNLNQYRKEKELLEQQLQKALAELPAEANIEALVQSLYEIGTKSGLVINSIEPKGENKSQFYAEVPLALSVTGNYHEIAVFFDSISKLKRIINVTGIKMLNPKLKNEQINVDSTFVATAFRFLPQPGNAAAAPK
jgi:type IV pilus assembly protein PilO